MSDIEARLRATLAEHARQAQDGDDLAERILAEVDTPARVLRPRHGWRTWTLPLLTAAAVAAVVATVVGLGSVHHTASPQPPGVSHKVTRSAMPTTAVPTESAPAPSNSPTAASATRTAASGVAPITGFHALDLTFVSNTQGWAVGPADCLDGSGTCTAIMQTADGTTWKGIKGARFNVPGVKTCTAPCVNHIRFANDTVGYAYSSDVLFMTTDAGASWVAQPGRGAEALETLDNNVIRLVASSADGCPGPCNVRVETAPIGSSTWTTEHLQPGDVDRPTQLARSGADAYVLAKQNPAGGASDATSTLFVSTDNGATWVARGEPCPQTGGEHDSTAIAAAPGRTVVATCVPRLSSGHAFVVVSHDAGAHFTRTAGRLPVTATAQLAGDPGTVLVAAGEGAFLSTDAAKTWHRVTPVTGTVSFAGFESPRVGRIVTDGGRTIWRTADGGGTWASIEFP